MSSLDERVDEKLVWVIAGALLIVYAIITWQSREIGLVSAQDDGRYILLARSLREFSYRDLYLVGLPFHSSYPPLYPAALAVWAMLFGEHYAGFVTMNVGLSVAALAIAFAALKRGWSSSGALICLALLVINPQLVNRGGGIWSENLFICLSFLALWALATREPGNRHLWLAGIAAIAAALTRGVGLALLVAVGIVWLSERRYKPLAAYAGAAVVTVGAWMSWSVLAPDQVVGYHYFADALSESNGGGGFISSVGSRIVSLLPNYAGLTTPWVLAVPTIPHTPLDNAVISVVTVVAILVGLVSLFPRWRVASTYAVLYGATLLLWPYHRPRFLEPVIPLLLCFFLLGIAVMIRRFRAGWVLPALGVVAVLLAFGGIRRTADHLRFRSSCGPFSIDAPPACLQADRASLLQAIDYVGRHTPAASVFVTAKPEALYFYTSRRSVLLRATLGSDPEQYVDNLSRMGVDYVILGSLHTDELNHLEPRLRLRCSELRVEAFFAPRTYVFRLNNGGSERERDACDALDDYRNANVGRSFIDDRA